MILKYKYKYKAENYTHIQVSSNSINEPLVFPSTDQWLIDATTF